MSSTIFQVCGIKNTNKVTIKHSNYKNGKDKFEDQEIELDESKTTVGAIMENVFYKMYKCNFPGSFLASTKKLPLMYALIINEQKFISGMLMSVYLYFTIKTDVKEFKYMDELLKSELDGSYTIEIGINGRKEIIELEQYEGYEKMIKKIKEIINSEFIKEILANEIKIRDEERIKKFGQMINEKPTQPKYNINDLVKKYQNGENIDEIIND